MMKTTQLLTNIKLWQNALLAFIFLFSLSTFSQVDAASAAVGDELTYNGMLSTDGDEGVTGSGTGCAPCGWNAMQGTNYAPTNNNNNNGACHSENRQFKMFATNGNNGSFVNQQITNLPTGTFTYDYWTKWAGVPTYTDENGDTLEPKFTIRVLQSDGSYAVVKEEVIPLSADQVWTQTTGTWENTEAGATVRLQWYKRGGTNGAPTGLNKSMFVDSVSFTYTAEASSGVSTFPYCTTFDADLGDWTSELISGSGSYVPWYVSNTNYNGSVSPQNGAGMAFMYDNSAVANLTSTAMDISGLTDPQLTFSYTQPTWSGDQDELRVWYKAAAGDDWTELAAYTSSVTAWETVTLDLPNASSDYYIAFNGTAGYGYGLTLDDVCVDAAPTEPLMSVTATTNGGSATFSFDIQNFTVGASGDTGVDGHIHYSLNGGSEVMVYSSDDLTLSDLPNGDHTIVFSLVDDAHQALDPAVTATVEFSTFDGTVACDDSFTYTYDNNESGTLFTASNPGGEVTVTVTGETENNYDFLIVRDGAGNVLYDASGDHTGQVITSTDGTLDVEITSDGSVNGSSFGAITFDVTCAASLTNVTFSVNTENIEVGDSGIYLGGGVFGNATAHAMSDSDGDGVWEVTVQLEPGTTGNYIFLNGPTNGDDWGTKENLNGQDCADPNNYDDRILEAVGTEDYTLLHCFGECSGNGTGECPAPSTTYNVTFSVNMSNYPGGLGADDTVYLNGNFVGWCGDCTPMNDDDGDGIWTVTVALEDGDYEYKFTINGWSVQEEFGSIGAVEGCTVTDGTYTNRAFTVAGADMTLDTVFWNLCPGETPGQVYNVTFAVDTANITVGDSGMYLGGGAFGDAQGNAMSDDDGDGIWEVTLELNTDQIGVNYIFLNGPNDGGDWGTKENLEGQSCADPNNYNDRILPEFDGDTYLLHCFGDCSGDGVGCSVAEDGMMVLQGIIDFTVPSGGSDGKAIHVLVTEDIADLSNYGIGVANNGGGTDGEEYVFPAGSATAGQHILVARSLEAMEAYGMTGFDQVLEASSDISQNGDDAIELYFAGGVVEVFGDVDVDGTGQDWEYMDSWAYKVDGAWTYGGVDCTDGSTTTCDSGCPYPFVNCGGDITFPLCEDFEDGTDGWTFIDVGGLTSDWLIDTPANGDSSASLGHGYLPSDAAYDDWAISPSYDTSGLTDATVSYYEYLNWSADATAHNVWYSTDYAGDATAATWVLLNDVIGTDAEDVFVQRTFDIPSAESVVIGFQYNSTYGADWNIDDMCIDGTLSTSNNEILDMMIYPNPVDGNYVTILSPVSGAKNIEVYTVTGRKVMETTINGNTLDVSSFNSGFYMLKVTIDGQSKVSKLVVR